MKRSLTVLAAAALLVGLLASPAVAAETTGSWVQYPNGATSYFAEVQQPINSANTSNWSAKSKGGIPVMYKLFEQVGPAVFQSIGSNGYDGYAGGSGTDYDDDYAYMSFTPDALTLEQVVTLKTDYDWVFGDCHGGSLRWQIRTSASQAIFVYYGSVPQFGNGGVDGCNPDTGGANQSGVNMMTFADARFDTSQYAGGAWYDTWAHALTLIGADTPVMRVSLVIDSGWQGMSTATDQRLIVSNTTVNDNVYQWVSGGSDTLTPTCDLPDAFIDVTRTDPTPDGVPNEATVYPTMGTDTGNQFRVVDCKYQYVLSIPSLAGKGTYDVEILIGGNEVATGGSSEVAFDLK